MLKPAVTKKTNEKQKTRQGWNLVYTKITKIQ